MQNDAISRSALINDMKGVVFREKPLWHAEVDALYQSIKDLYSGMIYLVETAPAIDAVPVIRCKDCKASQPCIDDNYVWCSLWHEEVARNGFCYEGTEGETE